MGLIVIETCAECGEQSVPTMEGSLEKGYKMCCRKCGSENFKPRDESKMFKQTCGRCGHQWVFNDLGCPKCTMQDLRDLGVPIKQLI
ncbi:hypothetical protein PONTUS_102 [Vibrio phage Pontus]|uniref:Uncharacterized protein n=1 Tax=Vibrio phage Pontus TaxID=2590874 RepID=A0A4Y6E8D0_9CAUD|nr:hypothetical protein KNU59_gp187 [Vibrio phage Pontus]QDF14741.1 hypothetical protein PONTUS_102 [Vibrio phage Pontus]